MSVFIFNIINGNGEDMYSEAFCNNTLKVDGKDEIGLLHVDLLSTQDIAVFSLLQFNNYFWFAPTENNSVCVHSDSFFYSNLQLSVFT